MTEARRDERDPEAVIRERLTKLTELVGGYDFADVIAAYWRGHDTGNEQLRADAVRWLRGEFATRTDARAALGVRTIVDDSQFYDQLKLMARFAALAGYSGLLVCLDEMVNLYKLGQLPGPQRQLRAGPAHPQRQPAGQRRAPRVPPRRHPRLPVRHPPRPVLLPRPAEPTRREQLRRRRAGRLLRPGPATGQPHARRTSSCCCSNLRHVQAGGQTDAYVVPDDALVAFMQHCSERIGEAYFRTPRTTIRSFLDLLAVLEQNPGTDWRHLLGNVVVEKDVDPALHDATGGERAADEDDELHDFRF